MPSENGTSVILVKVKPGFVEQAMKTLQNFSTVGAVETTLGPYDLLVTADTKNLAGLQRFQQELESQEFCDGCTTLPTLDEWERSGTTEFPVNGWVLISATDPQQAFTELQNVQSVQHAFTTVGPYNLVAHIGVDRPTEVPRTVIRDIHPIQGIRRTETLAGFNGI